MQHEESEEIELSEGMPVQNDDGEDLGKLAGMLVTDDEEEEPEFVIITSQGGERLIPYESIMGVGDGALLLDLPAKAMAKFPKIREGVEPTDSEIELAYKMYDEYGMSEEDEDEE